MKQPDPTKQRIQRDNEERKKLREQAKEDRLAKFVAGEFREASGRGNNKPVKNTASGYRAAAKRTKGL